jgi:hypothetical protein
MASEEMWMLIVRGISVFWAIALVPCPSGPSKAKPVLAALSGAVASVTQVVCPIVTFRAVVVELVFEVFFTTMLAYNQRLGIQSWCSQ